MHIAKYKAKHLVNLIKHYLREHLTDNVDRERLKDNIYELNEELKKLIDSSDKGQVETTLDYIFDTIDKRVGRKIKKDQNVMLDLIITQPDYLGKEYNKEFFDKMVDALQNKYNFKGFNPFKKENMICNAIHLDEQGQPHMHYSFMPITPNFTRRQRHKENSKYHMLDLDHERLCSDSFMHLDFLNSFHKNMEELTGYTLTKTDGIIRDLTMQEYQKQQEIEKLKERIKNKDNEKETLQELNDKLDKENIKLIEQKKELQKDISELDKVIEKKQEHIQQFERKLDNREILVPELQEKNKGIFANDKEIVFDRQQYEMQQQQLQQFEKLIRDKAEKEKEKIKEEYDKLYAEREKTDYYKNWGNCEQEINKVKEYYKGIENEKTKLEIANMGLKRDYKDLSESIDIKIDKATNNLKLDNTKLTDTNKWLNKLIYNLEQFILNKTDLPLNQKQLDFIEENGKLPRTNEYTR